MVNSFQLCLGSSCSILLLGVSYAIDTTVWRFITAVSDGFELESFLPAAVFYSFSSTGASVSESWLFIFSLSAFLEVAFFFPLEAVFFSTSG